MGWKARDPRDLTPVNTAELYAAFLAGVSARKSFARDDTEKVLLWGVDWQYDFLAKDGTLTVPGGLDALKRFLEFAYDNAKRVTRVTSSADDHPYPQMIFFPAAWVDPSGVNPPPSGANLTVITYKDLLQKKWLAVMNPVWQFKYVNALEGYNKQLVIWPLHCMRGTPGATLAPAWLEFMNYWAGLRNAVYKIQYKGSFWGSEMYAPQEALVKHPGDPNSELTALYDEMEAATLIYPGGVAENFCVDEWVRANIRKFVEQRQKPEVMAKFHFNREYTSPIQFPGYEDLLRAQYTYYKQNGVVFDGVNPYA